MDGIEQAKAHLRWFDDDPSRIPYGVYQNAAVYALEQERIFKGPTWNYVGLAAEVPEPGDWRRTFIGETSVVMVRGQDGAINALENRCAHRGARVCQALHGNTGTALMCPYHQWTYDLEGNLVGVPFRRGVKGKGGMDAGFVPDDHGLVRLRCETLNGVVFATFSPDVPPLVDYMGPEMMHYFTRVFDGRGLRVLGCHRQWIDCNWKIQMENLKDPYHAGLLHVFLVTFGLFRVDQDSKCVMDEGKGHSVMVSRRAKPEDREGLEDVANYTPDFTLEDMRLIQPRKEFPDDVTLAIQTIFPNIIVQAQSNTLATRHVLSKGPGAHELVWTFFGYDDDDEELTTLRLRQANLMGPAGYVTLDDAEALEMSQAGVDGAPPDDRAVLDLGGRDTEPGDHLVTEAAIRGFYQCYRAIMGFD